MNTLRGYIPFVLLLALAIACGGGISTQSTPAPEDISGSEPTPTTVDTTSSDSFPAESILTFNGDPEPFNSPTGIDIDAQGNIYVADFFNHRVVKFDPNGTRVSQAGSFGDGEENFLPYGIAVDAQGNVFVTDQTGERVRKFDGDGNPLTEWGGLGSGEGQFDDPGPITVDAEGNVFVGDVQNSRVQKFDTDGNFLSAWGSQGDQDGQFIRIGGIAIDQQGYVYVGDTNGATNLVRISIFDNSGNFLMKWEHINCIYGTYEINGVGGIWFDSQNRLFMVVSPPSICVLDQNGTYLGNWGTKGAEAGQLDLPIDLVGDNADNIYVLEYSNNRVQKFQIK